MEPEPYLVYMRECVIGGSFRPFHNGHYELIKIASKENDKVNIFVSLADRGGQDDEAKIYGTDTQQIWEEHIIPILPINVSVIFCQAPVRDIYKFIGDANLSKSNNTYSVYADPSDIDDYYPELVRHKYFGKLYTKGRVVFIPTPRSTTCEISGTELRKMIFYGMKDEFCSFMPETMFNKEKVWETLYNNHKNKLNPNNYQITNDFFKYSR